MQYSKNLQIIDSGNENWVLLIDNERVFEYLKAKLKTDFGFGRFMKTSSSFGGGKGFEYKIELSEISKDVFVRHIGIITPEYLDDVASGIS